MGYTFAKMKVPIAALVALMVVMQLADGRGLRARRGFNSSGFGPGGYGRGSDERDASVSQEGLGCNGNVGRGYGSNSGSRELPFKDGRDSGSAERVRGGRSFSRASATASASSSSYNGNHKANLVETVKPKQK